MEEPEEAVAAIPTRYDYVQARVLFARHRYSKKGGVNKKRYYRKSRTDTRPWEESGEARESESFENDNFDEIIDDEEEPVEEEKPKPKAAAKKQEAKTVTPRGAQSNKSNKSNKSKRATEKPTTAADIKEPRSKRQNAGNTRI